MKDIKEKHMKIIIMIVMVVAAIVSEASPLAVPAKIAVREAAERIGVRAGAEAGTRALVRGGSALAAVTAERESAKASARAIAGGIAEKVTPGKILAVGGATAVVVGTHEVADGVQTMGASVGKAVEENPDAAVELGREILSLPKTVISIAGVFIMVVLAWFVWPFLVLARNFLRLAVSRRLRMAGLVHEPDLSKMVAAHGGHASTGALVWIVGAFVLLTALGIWRAVESHGRAGVSKPHRANVVAEICEKYDNAVERHLNAFRADVDATAKERFGRVRCNVPCVAAKFGTMSKCAALVKSITLDKMKDGKRTENEIKNSLEADYYRGLYAASDAVSGCLDRLKGNLEQDSKEFRGELERKLVSKGLQGDKEFKELLEACETRINAAKREQSLSQRDAGVAVAFEAICVRHTVSVIARILGKAAARQAGTMVAGAGAAVVDGPLPILDAIAAISIAGCTAWTGWDVYKATKVIPKKLSQTLYSTVDECERQCREDVLRRGEELSRRFVLRKATS